jgi:hypothetical protein
VALAFVVGLVALSSALAAPTQATRQQRSSGVNDLPPCCTVVLHLPNTYSLLLNTILAPPTGYTMSAPGIWSGPPYHLNKPGAVSKVATIKWWVKADHVSTAPDAAARAFTVDPAAFTQVKASGSVEVPHVVGGSQVGTLTGYSVLLQSSQPTQNAQYQGLVSFPIGVPAPLSKSASRSPNFVVIRFLIREPSSDRYVVGDAATPGPVWNLQQIQAALAGVQMVGSLPPAQFTATVRRVSSKCCRAVVRGSVTDSLGHPVAGARVTLFRDLPQTESQKRHHAKVKSVIVSDARSAPSGTFLVRVSKEAPRGSYRMQVQLAHSVVVRAVTLDPA